VCINVLYGDVVSWRRFFEETFCMCATVTVGDKRLHAAAKKYGYLNLYISSHMQCFFFVGRKLK
jgi:hypothetical protein